MKIKNYKNKLEIENIFIICYTRLKNISLKFTLVSFYSI